MVNKIAENETWEALLLKLRQKKESILGMGGVEKVNKHNWNSRMDARQRIHCLADENSFMEIGTFVGCVSRNGLPPVPADGLIAGSAKIKGRPVLIGAEDFTVKGGSIGIGTHAKRLRLALLAAQERIPLIMLLEGAGERLTNAFERYPYAPNDLEALVPLSGMVPTVAVIMGASAGHGALTAPLMDFVVMTRDASIFSAGPPLVAAATGELVTKETLGGVDIHGRESGVVHNVAETDADALAMVIKYLSYLPTNAWQMPPFHATGEDGHRKLDGILDLIPPTPNKAYDARKLVEMLVDSDSFFDIQPYFGESILTYFARLGGHSVAVIANQPLVKAGAIDRDAADKAAHFCEIVDGYHLPVIFLADNPGVMAGTAAERSGALRSAARMYAAQAKIRSPKFHVTIRKAYGFGSSIMAMNPFDKQTITLAFPGATLGAMPAGSGGDAAGVDQQMRQELYDLETGGPWSPADTMAYDEIIDPRDLRNYLLSALDLSSARRTAPVEPRAGGIRP